MPLTLAIADYQVRPLVHPVGRPSLLTVRPLGAHAAFTDGAQYIVRVMPLERTLSPRPREDYPGLSVTAAGGVLRFAWTFGEEQEHYLRIMQADHPLDKERLCSLRVYALQDDLLALSPYRGDLHVHSSYSDGHESPAVVAANYRKDGYDFLALTDHYRYAPSLEAIAAYAGKKADLALYPGEEVHTAGNHNHIVNFGGSFSVNEKARGDLDAYEREVAAIEQGLSLPPDVDRHEAAVMHWCFQQIRAGGGLAIFPHPHWIPDVYHVQDSLSRYLFASRAFDAFELLGGQTQRENLLQTAFYHEMLRLSCDSPVVGSSDSHGTVDCQWYDWSSTIVLARSLAFEDIRQAVLDRRSVAVATYPREAPRFYGDYRIVKYVIFLYDVYFPLHNELCFEEGRLMKDMVTGIDEGAGDLLARLSGRTARLLAQCMGRA